MTQYFKPIYQPYNNAAKQLLLEVADDLQVSLKGKLGQRREAVLASFLYYAQSRDSDSLLTWPTGGTSQHTNAYSFFPAAGADIIRKVSTELLEHGYLRDAGERPSGLGDWTIEELNEFVSYDIGGLISPATTFQIMDVPLLDKKRQCHPAVPDDRASDAWFQE